jgi:hypothetical protein
MRKRTLVLSVAMAGSIALSLWLWSEWDGERAANLDLHRRIAELGRRQEDSAVPAKAVASAELLTGRAIDSHLDARPALPAYSTPSNYPGRFQQRLLKNPQFRQALKMQQRVALETEFRDLPRYLNLTADQTDRLFDLMAEQGVSVLDLQWRDLRNPGEGQSRKELSAELRKQNDAALANLLGDQNLNRLHEFRSTLQSRAEVSSVRNELAMSSDPLREDQVEPMIAVVDAELQRMNQEIRDLAASAEQISDLKRSELAIAANQRIVEAAVPILTSVQLAALKDLYRRQRVQMDAQAELNRLQSEAEIVDSKAVALN